MLILEPYNFKRENAPQFILLTVAEHCMCIHADSDAP